MNVVPKYSPLTVKEIAHEVMDILGIRKEIIWDKSKVWAGDNKLLAADGGLYHSLRLSDNSSLTSIRKVANEYRNNNNSGK
jgi:hypothetical protein